MTILERLIAFVAELRRRRVYGALGVYAVAAWLLIQVAETTFPYLGFPDTAVTFVIVVAVLGFPVAATLAWVFEWTGGELRRTGPPVPAENVNPPALPRWIRAPLGVVFLAGIAVAGALWVRAYAPPPVRADAVAVLPFEVRGSASLVYLGDGLVDLLSRNLEGAAGLRTIDPHTIARTTRALSDEAAVDAATASRIAERLGARRFVLGSVTEHADELVLAARLYDVGDPAEPVSASVHGHHDALFKLVDELSAKLLVQRAGPASAQVTRTAARTSASFAALKEFLRAEQALRAAEYDSAVAGFQRAVAEDTTFALAYYRLAIAAALGRSGGVSDIAIARAQRHSERLGERDRRLLDAFAALRAGRANEAERRYRKFLQDYPDDLEARLQLGELLVRYNPLRGRPAGEAREHLASVNVLDPAFLCPLCIMVNLAVQDGDIEAADSLMGLRYPGARLAAWDAAKTAARGDSAEAERLRLDHWPYVERTSTQNWRAASAVLWQASWVAAFFGRYGYAERSLRPLTARQYRDELRVYAHLALADLHIARGRWSAARGELDLAEPISARRVQLRRAYCVLLPFHDRPSNEVNAVRAELLAWDPAAEPAAELAPLEELLPSGRLYLLALASAELGDADAALDYAEQLERDYASATAPGLSRDLALTVRADLALRQDQPDAALRDLDQITGDVPLEVIDRAAANGSFRLETADLFTGEYARFLRAEALLRRGRAREALRWLDHGFFRLGGNPLYAPSLDLLRAESYDALGDREQARRYYARALAAWSEADAEFRPFRERVRSRLEALAPEAH